ncbi:GGDEF domain-containing protein [Paenibacillus cremeus]|uniref:GGDEF domain-containing protein n=1 Tax=Paenibacillus cremeus TaxID=2163881 RepID=UPI001647EA02|nr:GGDEF domain-containing protein [Paenibacillus cremeus]
MNNWSIAQRYRGRLVGTAFGLVQSVVWIVLVLGYLSVRVVIAACLFMVLGWVLGQQYDKVKYYSEKDALTKLYNRRFIARVFPKLKSLMDRRQKKLGLFVVDVDQFKKINDMYGHVIGDKVLTELSNLLLANVRNTDFVARWGGDEFVIVSPDIGVDGADKVITRMKEKLEALRRANDWTLSVSIGSAIYPDEADTLEALIHEADQKMYQIKFGE